MDNFDKEDETHDTILMLFQNHNFAENVSLEKDISSIRMKSTKRKLQTTLPCQELLPSMKGKKRGEIPSDFDSANTACSEHDSRYYDDHWFWLLNRYVLSTDEDHSELPGIPSFSAMNSILTNIFVFKSTEALVPILPFPATTYDAVYTTMVNFQDILKQKQQPYGPLWCDEGVYHIAKELQFLNTRTFHNIFLGLGGFHLEREF